MIKLAPPQVEELRIYKYLETKAFLILKGIAEIIEEPGGGTQIRIRR